MHSPTAELIQRIHATQFPKISTCNYQLLTVVVVLVMIMNMNPEIVSFQYTTGMCLLLENVGGCVHAGRPEVVTLNICYN